MMFFRNSAWTRELLDAVWALRFMKGINEQMAIEDFLEARGEFDYGNKHFIKIDQYKMNAYPEEITCHQDGGRPWRPGDWVIHFPVRVHFDLTNSGRGLGYISKIEKIRGEIW
jgi:hypothetical protein